MLNNSKKEVNLIGRDFSQLRTFLIDFVKQYYPNTYNDFNESSPGMMFLEIAAYVGDVLSYYTDTQLRESILEQAKEKKNVLSIAQSFGYKPTLYTPSNTIVTLYQLVPELNSNPDFRYALYLPAGTEITSVSNQNVIFSTSYPVDFNINTADNPRTETEYGSERFLLSKKVEVTSGKLLSKTFTFGSPKPYDKININDENIIDIVSIQDSNGEKWTKVDFLAQQNVFDKIENISANNTGLDQYAADTPYILKLKKVPKRYITRIEPDGSISAQFGAGLTTQETDLIPDPKLSLKLDNIPTFIDPSNFLYTSEYGLAPANTTLTVSYKVANGIIDNVSVGELQNIILNENITTNENVSSLSPTLVDEVLKSLASTNQSGSSGARLPQEVEEIRNNAMAFFATQNRAVTLSDYIVRAYSMPSQFGNVSKVYAVPDYKIRSNKKNGTINQLALSFYVLGKGADGNLTKLNEATKQNLKNYISEYRILTDAINILDGNIINIAVDFEIVVLPGYNANEVLLKCIAELKNYFNIDKWQINQPILLSDIYVLLDSVDGVQTVLRPSQSGEGGLQIKRVDGENYNISAATKNGIIYPAKDPSIFELASPNSNIKGRVVPLF